MVQTASEGREYIKNNPIKEVKSTREYDSPAKPKPKKGAVKTGGTRKKPTLKKRHSQKLKNPAPSISGMSLRSQKKKRPASEVGKIAKDLKSAKKQRKLNSLERSALEGASFVAR